MPEFATTKIQIDRHAASAARRFLDGLRTVELSGEARSRVRLVASEFVTNAYRHGPHDRQLAIRAGLDTAGAFRLEVNSPRGTALPELHQPGSRSGLGLHLVQRLSNDWGVLPEEDTVTVWATFSPR